MINTITSPIRAYLNDYEFRINRLDEEIKLLFGG